MSSTSSILKSMLDELTIPSLRKFAANKGISKTISIPKDELIRLILQDIDKLPEEKNIDKLYHSLDDEYKNFINYLLVKGERANISSILGTTLTSTHYWDLLNMRTIRKILGKLVPTGLVFFDPPPSYLSGSNKYDYYKFYIPDNIRKKLMLRMINPCKDCSSKSIKSIKEYFTDDIVRVVLLTKLTKQDENIKEKLPKSITEIAEDMAEDLKIDDFGIFSRYRKRYLRSVPDLYKTLAAFALFKISKKEKDLYDFLLDLPHDKWFFEQEILGVLNKYTKSEYTNKARTRLHALGFIRTAKHGEKNLINICKTVNELNSKPCDMNKKINLNETDKLTTHELFIIFKYFNLLKEHRKPYELELSFSKVGHALEHGDDIVSIKNDMNSIGALEHKSIKDKLNAADNKFGNFLIHNHLSIYEINDPQVVYKLEASRSKSCSETCFLEDKYLLVPGREHDEVEKVIRRGGFVIKSKSK